LFAGDAGEAVKRLPLIIQNFVELHMDDYAAQARLDLAESHLITGHYHDVERLCAEVIASYRKAETLTGAVTAAHFLKDGARRRIIVRRHFEHVRQYLCALERSPQLEFVPPREAAELRVQGDRENETSGIGRSSPCGSAAI
jgi:hypothetical protein